MSTTTDSDGAALLKAIAEQPDEDTVRLAYADWLEENGQGERAEFIRVQIEIARLGPKHRELFVADGAGQRLEGLGVALTPRGDGHYSASDLERGLSTETFAPNERVDIYAHLARKDRVGWMRGLKYVKHVEARHEIIFRKDEQSGPWKGAMLAKRVDELLSAHGREWANSVIPEAMPSSWSPHNPTPYLVLPGPSFVNIAFDRGFVHSVTCTTADWLKHADALVWQCLRCPSCDGAGWRRWQTYSGYDEEPCDRCEETGLIREAFPPTAQPITKVTLTTRSNWMHRDGKIYLHDGNFEVGAHRFCRNSEIWPEVTDLERLAESRDYLATLFHDEWPGIEIEGITT